MSHSGYTLNIGESNPADKTKSSQKQETPISIILFVVIAMHYDKSISSDAY